MNRPENLCQPQEYSPEMFAEYFENEKKRALRISEIEVILGDNYDLDRLRELVEADRDGRCVVLPCKVGDTVYLLNHHLGRIFENVVSSFSVGYGSNNKNTINTVYIGKCGAKTFRKWKFQQIGKTVFLDREAAEAALKGGSDGV